VRAVDDAALTIYYWYVRSMAAHVRRDGAAMLPLAQRVVELSQAAGDRRMEAAGLSVVVAAYQNLSRLTEALRVHECMEEIYRALGASSQMRMARVNRASVLLQIGRLDEAAMILRAAYDEAKGSAVHGSAFFAALNLGWAMFARGQLHAALELQSEALELAREIASDGYAALALGDRGGTHIALGDDAAARADLNAAIEMNRRLDRPAVLANDLARISLAEPRAQDGAARARAALALVEEDSERVALAPGILFDCARAFTRAEDAAAAEYCRRRGREIVIARLRLLEDDDRGFYFALPWHAALFEPGTRVEAVIADGREVPV
jgi:tetratricopeptide (TPR) repeat protein